MADSSLQTVLGLTLETVPGTFVAPGIDDLLVVADLRPQIEGLTADIREYTGSIHRPGPTVTGKALTITGRVLLRGPGGASPPTADTWPLGRLLRGVGFAEVITSAAVPAAPEAVAATGDTTHAVLGASASTTDDTYTCMMLLLSALGVNRAGLTMVRDYTGATKSALLAETAAAPIAAGNWQVPKQLSYVLSPALPPTLSSSCWVGRRRVNGRGMAISSFRWNQPTASRDSQDVPSIEFTLTGEVESVVDDLNPPQPPLGLAVPPFRDGKMWIANKQLGGSGFTIDFGAQVGYPPNPNKETGNENAQLTETTRTVDITLNQVLLTEFDDVTLAEGQDYHGLMALWGLAPGNAFGLIVTDMRFNHRSPDNSGAFVTNTGQAFIDGVSKTIAVSIPYGTPF